MRIAQLDLLRYGHFTDRVLELPWSEVDLHIVHGPNAAGKSTARTAIGDALFSIPGRTPLGFVHGYKEMRLGVVLESDEGSAEFIRCKGSKDTLRGPDDKPILESALQPYLHGADRAFFDRMFSLDYEGLRKGGAEILHAKNELGQMLYAASAGVAGLADELNRIEEEAKTLWAKTKSKNRAYYLAYAVYEEAQKQVRTATVNARGWKELRKAFEKTERALNDKISERTKLEEQRNRLQRIQRLLPHVASLRELEQARQAIGTVVELPADASETFRGMQSEIARTGALHQQAQIRLRRLKNKLADVPTDDDLLSVADDIRALEKQRIGLLTMRTDLPKRKAELKERETQAADLAGELGWPEQKIGEIRARLPNRLAVARIRELLEERAGLDERIEAKRTAVEKSQSRLEHAQVALAELGEPVDVALLETAVADAQPHAKIDEDIAELEDEMKQRRDRLSLSMKELAPWSGTPEELATLTLPTQPKIDDTKEALEGLRERWRDVKAKQDKTDEELEDKRTRREAIAKGGAVVPHDDLLRARERRDLGWRIVRRRYVEGLEVTQEDLEAFGEADPVQGFESALTAADNLADRRFAAASATAQLAEVEAAIGALDKRLKDLERKLHAVENDSTRVHSRWADILRTAQLEDLLPEAFRAWLVKRKATLDEWTLLRRAETSLNRKRSERDGARNGLQHALRDLQELVPEGANFGRLLATAAKALSNFNQLESERKALKRALKSASNELEETKRDLAEARKAETEWQAAWSEATATLGFEAETPTSVVRAALDLIERLQEATDKVDALKKERIGPMQRDIEQFEAEATAFEQSHGVTASSGDDVVIELVRRLSEQERARDDRKRLEGEIQEVEETIRGYDQKLLEVNARLEPLLEAAGTRDHGELERLIARSDEYRGLQNGLTKARKAVLDSAGGLPVEEAVVQCDGKDAANLEAEIAALNDRIARTNDDVQQLAVERSEKERAFKAIVGDADAAAADTDRQLALGTMREVIERYVRLRMSAKLLRWAIEKYRREKQAPLLTRASDMFRTITLTEFERLEVDFEEDTPVLVGIRPSGQLVTVDGMSDGTEDQLYLVLRIAALEDYLEKAPPLPFIADDLFVRFSDDRAAAGFEILARLARKTQVLFFTLHEHLLPVAERALEPDAFQVHKLERPLEREQKAADATA